MWRSLWLLLLFLMAACVQAPASAPATAEHLYTTWSTLELDSCAAAWLIKRFVDSDAQFHFIPQGELVTEGIPFDVPGAQWTRTHRHTTFASILLDAGIEDAALMAIGDLIHAIEIDYWDNVDPHAEAVNQDILQIIERTADLDQVIQQCIAYFDQLYPTLTERQ